MKKLSFLNQALAIVATMTFINCGGDATLKVNKSAVETNQSDETEISVNINAHIQTAEKSFLKQYVIHDNDGNRQDLADLIGETYSIIMYLDNVENNQETGTITNEMWGTGFFAYTIKSRNYTNQTDLRIEVEITNITNSTILLSGSSATAIDPSKMNAHELSIILSEVNNGTMNDGFDKSYPAAAYGSIDLRNVGMGIGLLDVDMVQTDNQIEIDLIYYNPEDNDGPQSDAECAIYFDTNTSSLGIVSYYDDGTGQPSVTSVSSDIQEIPGGNIAIISDYYEDPETFEDEVNVCMLSILLDANDNSNNQLLAFDVTFGHDDPTLATTYSITIDY